MVRVSKLIQQHLQLILTPYLQPGERMPPLDRHISDYFKKYKSLGASQRRQLYNHTYDMIRYHFLLNHLCKGSKDLGHRLELLHSSDFYAEMQNPNLSKYPPCHADGFDAPSPNCNLYERIQNSLPSEMNALEICRNLNTRAPLTLRINPDITERGDFLKKLSNTLKIDVLKTQISPYGIIIPSNKNIDLHETDLFKGGHFQVQDQASQLAALQVKCRPGDLVLDFCSGSGGKSLAIAHLLRGKGQIFLHDPRVKSLQNAKKRFQRAKVQNVQFHQNQENLIKILSGKADWIILDVPCTGTGTIRRNPDIKLKINEKSIENNVLKQQQIFARALKYLSKNGRIAYMTCSILKQENQSQIRKFIKQFNLQVQDGQILRTQTGKGGMDSMFAAVLKRK